MDICLLVDRCMLFTMPCGRMVLSLIGIKQHSLCKYYKAAIREEWDANYEVCSVFVYQRKQSPQSNMALVG